MQGGIITTRTCTVRSSYLDEAAGIIPAVSRGRNPIVVLGRGRIQWARFFLLAAAWVDPGRSALQSAEQRCKGRYGRIHQVGKMSF